ncbi:MAG: MarR family transcriptional regulator [Gemmatimonadaceae bacterium]
MRQDIERFIERAGLMWEDDGLPRIAGRIFALALISEDALSLDEIAESLGVSKASVSNDTRLLERMGFIERVSRPGDRRDYYQSNERSFERAIAERIRRMKDLQDLIESGRALAVKSPAVRERLDDHHLAFSHITRALQSALEELKARHQLEAKTR